MRNYKKENNYNKENYDILKVVLNKEDGEIIRKICKKHNISISKFISDSIKSSTLYNIFKRED